MTTIFGLARSVFLGKFPFAIPAMTMLILVCTVGVPPANAHKNPHFQTLRGTVEGNGNAQPGFAVSLYASEAGSHSNGQVLGRAKTDRDGKFKIHYRLLHGQPFVLFVIAEYGPVMLAGVIGSGHHVHDAVVINERTTVATGTAFAQFVDNRNIHGNTYGMLNAVKMAENMANPETGDVGGVLFNEPNGTETSTYPTFNSLTNVVASCVADDTNCYSLFAATMPDGEPAPTTVLQAVANIAKYPWYPGYSTDSDDLLFVLSILESTNQPALAKSPLTKADLPGSTIIIVRHFKMKFPAPASA